MPPLASACLARQHKANKGCMISTATGLLGAGVLLLATTSAAEASMLLTVEQIGADVVITGSGSINTTGFTEYGTRDDYDNELSDIKIFAGPATSSNGSVTTWKGLAGALTIGTASTVFRPDSSTTSSFGQLFGIEADSTPDAIGGIPLLVLPQNYVSGSALSVTSRYSNKTLSQLGLTPGTQTWSVGSGASLQTVQITTSVPVPAPLGFAGVPVVFSSIRRLQRNTNILKQSSRQQIKRA